MNPVVYHIAGGASFFTGVVLMLFAVSLMLLEQRLGKRVGVILFCLGGIAVAISSTPLPYWLLAVAMLASLVWIVLAWMDKWQRWATGAMVVVWIVAATWEATHWGTPSLRPVDARAVTIIGDSVTAGMGLKHEMTWPTLFAEQHDTVAAS